jgi:release factor glutamine methyltransferase
MRAAAIARIDPLDADVLVAHALGITKESLYAHPEAPLNGAESARVAELVERRAAGEPVAYLRGSKEFYALRFAVDARVLIPRPETETLVDAVRAFLHGRGPRLVVDVGTGSGAIAIALAVSEPEVRLIATDVSDDALAVARANVAAHGVAERVELRQGDLLDPITEHVDAVAANLPYLRAAAVHELAGDRTSLAFEPAVAVVAGADGLALIRRCVADLPRVLAPGGAAFFECDPPQALAIAALWSGSSRVLRDAAGAERVVVLEQRHQLGQ